MTNPARTILVRFCDTAGQWQASFDGAPCVSYGGDFSMVAVRRLLEGYDRPAGDVELQIDQNLKTGAVLTCSAIWQPPDLLFQCPACEGRGGYVGLFEVETCKVCGGRKVVAG